MRYKQLLAVFAAVFVFTGCVTTPEPTRSDAALPDSRVNGAVRQTAFANRTYLPIVSNNLSVIAAENKADWDRIAKAMGYGANYPNLWR